MFFKIDMRYSARNIAELLLNIQSNSHTIIVANIVYLGESLAIRWYTNLGNTKEVERLKNGEKLIGYPNVRGKPAWFILPDTLLKDIQNELLLKKE